MKLADEKAVLFIDMLGFAALSKKYPVDVDDLVAHNRPSHRFTQILTGEGNRLSSASFDSGTSPFELQDDFSPQLFNLLRSNEIAQWRAN